MRIVAAQFVWLIGLVLFCSFMRSMDTHRDRDSLRAATACMRAASRFSCVPVIVAVDLFGSITASAAEECALVAVATAADARWAVTILSAAASAMVGELHCMAALVVRVEVGVVEVGLSCSGGLAWLLVGLFFDEK